MQMVSQDILDEMTRRLIAEFQPEQIILNTFPDRDFEEDE